MTSTTLLTGPKKRFYYKIAYRNKYGLIWALSRLDALRQLAYSEDMVELQHVEWLTE